MRLHRADPLLNDAIEALDQRLLQAKRAFPKSNDEERRALAWSYLSPVELSFVHDEIASCCSNRVYYLQNYHVIQPEGGVLTCMTSLFDHQWMIEELLTKLIAERGHAYIVILKSRQTGGTEYCNGVMCNRTFFLPNSFTLTIAQNPRTVGWVQRKVNVAYDNLPWWMRPERQYHNRGEYMEFGRKDESQRGVDPGLGTVMVTTHEGETGGIAIGKCQVPGTVVWTEVGPRTLHEIFVEYAVSDSCEKDSVGEWYQLCRPLRVYSSKDSTAVLRTVTRIYKQRYEGPLQHCKIEGGVDIHKTPQHGVLCEDQWKQILTKGDFVSRLGRIPRSVDEHCRTFPAEAELIGWQLAEGHELKNSLYITQKCDVTRNYIADLVARVAKPDTLYNRPACGKITKLGNERSGYVTAGCKNYRKSLESRGYRWGCDSRGKTIPDFIYTSTDECVAAFLKGFFEADGSVSHVIEIGQVSKSLMEGLRFLLARLGITLRFSTAKSRKTKFGDREYVGTFYRGFIGGPSLVKFYEKVGFISERKQKRLLTTVLKAKGSNSERAITATRMMRQGAKEGGLTIKWLAGTKYTSKQFLTAKSAEAVLDKWRKALEAPPTYRGGGRVQKPFESINKAASLQWIKRMEAELAKNRQFDSVVSVEEYDYCGDVFDLEVEDTHCYTVSGLITHNTIRSLHMTECGKWPQSDIFTSDIKPSLKNSPDPVVFAESTAFGTNSVLHDVWEAAMDDADEDCDWVPLFLPAYRDPRNRRTISIKQQPFVLTDDEKKIQTRVQVEENFTIPAEFWNFRRRGIKDSIAESGYPYGHLEAYPITAREAFQSSGYSAFARHKLDQQEANVRRPLWVGEIVFQGRGAIPKIMLEYMLDGEGKYRNVQLPHRGTMGGRFYLWEQPDPNAIYYIAGDAGEGIGQDYSVAEILKAGFLNEPDIQVGEWVGNDEPPEAFGRILYSIGYYFNRSEIAVEYNGPGRSTADYLLNQLEYPHIYIPRRTDHFKSQIATFAHWQTTPKTKPLLKNKMNETLLENGILIQSEYLLDELRACEQDGESFSAMEGHDDAAMAMVIALYCLRQTAPDLRRPAESTTTATTSAAVARALHPPLGAVIYGVYNQFLQQVHQRRTLVQAEQDIAAHPGWSIRPLRVSKANTAYSVIHHGRGLENELFAGGMVDREITPAIVTQYAAATGRLDGMFNSPLSGAASPGADAQWNSSLGDLGSGELGDWSEMQ